jgi:protein-disulfide isomerase
MKPSVIIALLVGGVVGFAVGSMFQKPSTDGASPTVAAVPSGGAAARPAGAPPSDVSVYKVPVEESAVKGPATALITLVEFSDYQCPFCSRGHNTVLELEKQYEGKIRVVMKQHPLDFHPNAKPAALAALAAGEQGKYWDMHNKLFANQQALGDATYEQYAKELGLNVEKWKADLQSPKFQAQIASTPAHCSLV